MRILSVNIEGSRHLDKVETLIEEFDPDVVCFQELFERDRRVLSDRFAQVIHGPMSIQKQDHHAAEPVGVAFASNHAFEPITLRYAGPEELEHYIKFDEKLIQRWLLGGVLNGMAIVTTHMMVTQNASVEAFQHRDAHTILSHLDAFERVVFCGDLNAARGAPIYDLFARSLSDRIPKELETTLDPVLHRAAPINLVVDGAFTKNTNAQVEVRFGISDHAALLIETYE